ncbi:uncharacterized protein L203_103436 [Cryptococcus depauperatus CBS 7841]|uniref:Macrophage erythroblast attacher n=1 Tax=Cryptococcus depauperatus CBS 7841 TaxID=1295531 RepID=A0AAJ8JTL0_9TREE
MTLLLEEPLVRTSYELLRRSHRSAQRQVEKDFNAMNAGLSSILKSLNTTSYTEEDRKLIVGKLEQANERAKGLKRKLEDIQPSTSNPTSLSSRALYLEKIAPGSTRFSKTPKPTESDGQLDASKNQEDSEMTGDDGERTETVVSAPNRASPGTIDRYIADYLLRKGRTNSAQALAKKQGIEPLVDIKLFVELKKIEDSLVGKHSCTEALAWCGENRGTLKKTKNNIEFTLRLQEMIELCRKRDVAGAIAYSRKNLSGWAGTHMTELQKGMALLVFGERTGVDAYQRLYDQSRWETVRDKFRATFLDIYAQPSQSLLALSLSAGLAALRLPSCAQYHKPSKIGNDESVWDDSIPLLPAVPPLHNLELTLSSSVCSSMHLTTPLGGNPSSSSTDLHARPEAITGNIDCPTCDENMRVLASEVPMSHHVNSTIVCRITGEVMDSQNEPMAFPNGYVYSSKALTEMAKRNFNVVTCPRTRETCAFARLRKVYIS